MTDPTRDDAVPSGHPFEGLEGAAPEGVTAVDTVPQGLIKGKLAAVRAEWQVPLYRNAYLMMLNTVLTSGLGLVYWFVASAIYTEPEVGANTAMISAMVLLSNIAQLNGAQILMRYTPIAGRDTRKLVAATLFYPGLASAVLTAIVLIVAHFVVNDDNVLSVGPILGVWFVVSVVSWSLFNLQDAAFIGLRRVAWVPIDNTTFGVAKILLLFPFLALGREFGIFVSWTLPVLLSLFPLQWLLFRRFIPRHVEEATGNEPPIERQAVLRFIAWDYFGWMFAQASQTIVPLLVVSVLGKTPNAHYYMPSIIASAVNFIVVNLMTSLVVEASRDLSRTAHFSRLIIKRAVIVVVPAVVIIFVVAPFFFDILPGDYGTESPSVLRLLALSTIPGVVVALSNSLSRLDQRTQTVAFVQGVQATITVVMALVLMPHMGINGAALAVLISALVTAAFLFPGLVKRLSPRYAAKQAAITPAG